MPIRVDNTNDQSQLLLKNASFSGYQLLLTSDQGTAMKIFQKLDQIELQRKTATFLILNGN